MPEHRPTDVIVAYESEFNANDAAAMNALFTPDCTFVNFGGVLVDGRSDLLIAQKLVFDEGGVLQDISVTYTVERIIELTPNLCQIVAQQRTKGREQAESDPMHSRLVLTTQLIDNTWRIRTGQNTPVSVD
ncbi:SgcJ/EcaC family oxidoreductase [Nocardia callitridis]|uniref:DUF4440 domain-containing protein n=1 Tax=Nocardia callitridis TaxID=648753 RepID=A0ABP9JUK3_9NOCA